MDSLQDQIKDLQQKVENLTQRRIYQQDIVPSAVKSRHLGQANRFIYNGEHADRPTTGFSVTIGTQVFYEEDTKKLYIWNSQNKAWDYVQFT